MGVHGRQHVALHQVRQAQVVRRERPHGVVAGHRPGVGRRARVEVDAEQDIGVGIVGAHVPGGHIVMGALDREDPVLDVAGAQRDALVEQFLPAVDKCVEETIANFIVAYVARRDSGFARFLREELVDERIANRFAPALGRPIATRLPLGFFDQWVAAVGQADADTS